MAFIYCYRVAHKFNSSNNFRFNFFIPGRLYELLNKRRFYFFVLPIIFFIIQLPPGDYATWYVSQTKAIANITQEQAIELTITLREKYGLNDPIVFQYLNWIKNIIFNFDF